MTPQADAFRALPKASRFVPGTVVGDRFRVVCLLGRGGMGEVYRADDLKLQQPVALKFLPQAIAHDPRAVAQLHGEIRLARQISHPNVCRVFDVAEAGGVAFLTMEYVQGEDLGTLLRRIDRLSAEKALDIARQTCAGLAAAHAHGVLHQDLKPANVMLDASGRVRITDFGLSKLATDAGDGGIAGTLAYMSPERLAGSPGSIASDLYSLGLLLYEIFTGRRLFAAHSIEELRKAHADGLVKPPSQLVKGIDPSVERAILRCLDREAADRPRSAREVLEELEGREPTVTDEGEVGSATDPASTSRGGLRPSVACAFLALTAALVAAVLFFDTKTTFLAQFPDAKSSDALAEDARYLMREFGYSETGGHTASFFEPDLAFRDYARARGNAAFSRTSGALGTRFVYRHSRSVLRPLDAFQGVISSDDPPPTVAGMSTLVLDIHGRLRELLIVPPDGADDGNVPRQPDWAALFRAAGLDFSAWKRVPARFNPRVFADARDAWEGFLPELPDTPIRVEAASFQGKPVSFETIVPWRSGPSFEPADQPAGMKILTVVLLLLVAGSLIAVISIARNNVRAEIADKRGAYRLGIGTAVLVAGLRVVGSHHSWSTLHEYEILLFGCLKAIYCGCSVAVLWLAVEPPLRRRWPRALVAWNRLVAGRFNDPRVGREVFIGCGGAAALSLINGLETVVSTAQGRMSFAAFNAADASISGAIGGRAFQTLLSTIPVLGFVIYMLLFRALLRKTWLAMVPLAVVTIGLTVFFSGPSRLLVLLAPVSVVLMAVLLVRFGLLALFVAFGFRAYYLDIPITLPIDSWYRGIGVVALLAFAALTLYGFKTALAGKRIVDVSF